MTQASESHSNADSPATSPRDGAQEGCVLCGKPFPARQLVVLRALRQSLYERIAAGPALGGNDDRERWICKPCLAGVRLQAAMDSLGRERGELTSVEREIARKASEHVTLADDIDRRLETGRTLGQRVADAVARVGGSWGFLIAFAVVLIAWVLVNSRLLGARAFDPYPYILLNLVLSCVAAVQAPIIMMSQNRLARRDRMQADQDFRVNLKAELEIASLHEKVDHLLHSQWQHMVELQETQLEILNDLVADRGDT